MNDNPFIYTNYNSFVKFFEAQAIRHKDRTYIRYQSSDGELKFKPLTYDQVESIATYLANEWYQQLNGVQNVALLCDNPVQSLLAMIATLKLGRVFFPISVNNSEYATANLLSSTDTRYLIASKKYASIAQALGSRNSTIRIKIWESFNLENLTTLASKHNKSYSQPASNLNDIVLILQSSGSTGLPKPIYLSNRYVIMTIIIPMEEKGTTPENSYIESSDTLLATSSVFHGSGIYAYTAPITVGAQVLMFYKLPPSTLDLLSVATKNNATVMMTFPSQLEQVLKYLQSEGSDNESIRAAVRQFKLCLYFGASLPMTVGTLLHSQGLNVRCGYGTAGIDRPPLSGGSSNTYTFITGLTAQVELNIFALSNLTKGSQHWYMLKPTKATSKYCRWEPFDDGLYHLLVRGDCPSICPSIAAEVGPEGYYATNDLFQKDLMVPGYWRHIRRINDILTLSDGGKIDPVSLENEIRRTLIVKQCMVVGFNRSRTGVLIELNMEQAIDLQQAQITSKVYEAVTLANSTAAEAHSLIAVPEMVYILPSDKTLPSTSKGTIARKSATQSFEKEIEEMYSGF